MIYIYINIFFSVVSAYLFATSETDSSRAISGLALLLNLAAVWVNIANQ